MATATDTNPQIPPSLQSDSAALTSTSTSTSSNLGFGISLDDNGNEATDGSMTRSDSAGSISGLEGLDESVINAQKEAENEAKEAESIEAAAKLLNEEEVLPVVPKLLSTMSHDKLVQKTLDMKMRNQQLDLLLLKAESYSHFIAENQKRTLLAATLQQQEIVTPVSSGSKRKGADSTSNKGKQSPSSKSSRSNKADSPASGKKGDEVDLSNNDGSKEGGASLSTFTTVSAMQPRSLTGGVLLPHQVEGLKWLLSLWENGLSGILADEMGLGKTIQIISLIAHLRDFNTNGPYIIVCPLATVCNWINEFKKWCPSCPVVLYHGSKEHREQLRREKMPLHKQKDMSFPVIITSFEIAIIDRPFLERYSYQYLIVDEGQRIKNRNCKLLKELKKITPPSTTRLLLTGTPIQNKLEELWSLLNFCSPMIFDDLDVFQSYFGFHNIGLNPTSGGMTSGSSKSKIAGTSVDSIIVNEASSGVVTKLHEILRPFLLRRMKIDIKDISLPPKKEVIVYCNLTDLQTTYYKAVEDDMIRDLCGRMGVPGFKKVSQVNRLMNLRKACNHPFLFGEPTVNESGLDDALEMADRRTSTASSGANSDNSKQFHNGGRSFMARNSKKGVKYAELEEDDINDENAHLFETNFDDNDGNDNEDIGDITSGDQLASGRSFVSDISPEAIVKFSGKMIVLERMLTQLKEKGHKVLIFSQMTSMLDVLEQFCSFRKYRYVRFDGSTSMEERQESINSFSKKKTDKDKDKDKDKLKEESPDQDDLFIFLLSTRAGGLGINLTAADTCILFDSDFNPHMDSQAMDRCHRLGQTKPVMVYRLVSTAAAELEMMARQNSKKKLERLTVIGGDYRLAGKRLGKQLTIGSLKKLLQNDLHSLDKRFSMALSGTSNNNSNKGDNSMSIESSSLVSRDSSGQITDEELELILNRRAVFPSFYSEGVKSKSDADKGLTIPLEGLMYEIASSTSDMLNGFNNVI